LEVDKIANNPMTFVANMASYAIISSLILVIYDNMINGTNNIVKHVFVDNSSSQGSANIF
jgi:hypothetical protein